MYPSLLLSAALVAPAAPLPRDAAPEAPGPAPRVLALKADAAGAVRVAATIPTKVTVTNTYSVIEKNQQVQKQVEQDVLTSQYVNKTLAECGAKFSTADGTPLTLEEAIARVKGGATVLASADGKPVSRAWLRAAAPDTVVMVADGFASVQVQWGGDPLPTTPAPQLALLGTDEQGRVMAPCTSHPLNANGGVHYDNMVFEQRVALRGARIGNFGTGFVGPQPVDAKVVYKPLADVPFEAFDLSGKRVARSDALKRLAAGGLVLVAGDNRMPDAGYLKGLRDDVMILSAPDLVLPVPPVDQTRKKEPKADAPAGAKPLPAPPVQRLQPGVIIKGGAVRRNAALPAPKAEAKPVERQAEKK